MTPAEVAKAEADAQQQRIALLGPIPLGEQLACVHREIGMRKRVYPRWVDGGKMSQKKADAEIAAMQAVLATLEPIWAAEKAKGELAL